MKIRYRARAISDLEEIYRYLEPRSPTGAGNVLRSIHAAIGILAVHPHGAERTSDPEIRVKVLGRYRYKIFYSVTDSGAIEIVHIRHSRPATLAGGRLGLEELGTLMLPPISYRQPANFR
jgi:plasmid stabilization system protein ParE